MKIKNIRLTGNSIHNLCFLSRDFDLSFDLSFNDPGQFLGFIFRANGYDQGLGILFFPSRITFYEDFNYRHLTGFKETSYNVKIEAERKNTIRILAIGTAIKITINNILILSFNTTNISIGEISFFSDTMKDIDIADLTCLSLDVNFGQNPNYYLADFKDSANWKIVDGNWTPKENKLKGTAETKNIYISLEPVLKNITGFSFFIKNENDLKPNYGSGILFNFSEETRKGVALQCFSSHGYISLYPEYDLANYQSKSDICYKGIEHKHHALLKPNNWHFIQAVLDNKLLSVYFDGHLIHQLKDICSITNKILLFVGERNTAQFSDFRLYRSEETE